MTDLLLVDDDRIIRQRYAELFQSEGYSVRTARNGEEALKRFAERRPDVVVLDVAMPRLNGFAVCSEIRRLDASVPVLFLTAHALETNEVRGLDTGADDFLAKDVSESVLLARVRRAVGRANAEVSPESVLTLGTVSVNLSTFKISGGAEEELTRTEADILLLLSTDAERYFSPDELIAALRGQGFACEDSMLYTHISNLRRKLGPAGDAIVSRRGFGYRLVR